MRHPWQAVSRRGRQGVQAVALAVVALAANAHNHAIIPPRGHPCPTLFLELVTLW
mgnify:CR=1 FL=1